MLSIELYAWPSETDVWVKEFHKRRGYIILYKYVTHWHRNMPHAPERIDSRNSDLQMTDLTCWQRGSSFEETAVEYIYKRILCKFYSKFREERCQIIMPLSYNGQLRNRKLLWMILKEINLNFIFLFFYPLKDRRRFNNNTNLFKSLKKLMYIY